ncbi:MAG: hypothetical protein ACQER4_04845 [Bacteroidota bacterium]
MTDFKTHSTFSTATAGARGQADVAPPRRDHPTDKFAERQSMRSSQSRCSPFRSYLLLFAVLLPLAGCDLIDGTEVRNPDLTLDEAVTGEESQRRGSTASTDAMPF